jgi:hypothetical protein
VLLAGEGKTVYLFVVQVRVRLRVVICADLSGAWCFRQFVLVKHEPGMRKERVIYTDSTEGVDWRISKEVAGRNCISGASHS